MTFFRNLSVFGKIFGAIGVTVFGIVVFQVIYFPAQQIEANEEALRAKLRSFGEIMAQLVSPALEFGDTESAREGLQALDKDPDFAYAALINERGKITAKNGIDDEQAKALDAAWRDVPEVKEEAERLVMTYPITTKGNAKGILIIAVKTDEIVSKSAAIRSTTVYVGLLLIVFALTGALFVARVISRRLVNMATIADRVANGDLSAQPLDDAWGDEVGSMARSFNRVLASQRELVKQISGSAESISSTSSEFISNAQEQEQGLREQSATIEEISASMNALSDAARGVAENANAMAQVSGEMTNNAGTGQNALQAADASIKQIVVKNEEISDRINALYEKSQAIISVVDIIDDISDRLDLLALNAALEGSRVGEAGKGFSLVAQEMRRLAENVSGSTKEIKGTIEEIHRHIQVSLQSSQDGIATTREGAGQMKTMAEVFSQTFTLINASAESARSITVSAKQQLSGTQQMVSAMKQVAGVAAQGLSSAQEITHAAGDMTDLAARLRAQVQPFKIDP